MQLPQLREGDSRTPKVSKDASLAHGQGRLTQCSPARSSAATLTLGSW